MGVSVSEMISLDQNTNKPTCENDKYKMANSKP